MMKTSILRRLSRDFERFEKSVFSDRYDAGTAEIGR